MKKIMATSVALLLSVTLISDNNFISLNTKENYKKASQQLDTIHDMEYPTYVKTHKYIFADIMFSWIDAYAVTRYNSKTHEIVSVKMDSQIRGLSPSITWRQDDERSYVRLNPDRKGGSVHIVGYMKLNIMMGGKKRLNEKEISTDFSF